MVNNMPKYFVVKNDGSFYWREFIKWLNTTYRLDYIGNDWEYYGNNGYSNDLGCCFSHIYPSSTFHEESVYFDSPELFMNLINSKSTNKIHELWD